MLPTDTIVARASSAGASHRCLIRISGPGSNELIFRWIRNPPESPGAGRCRLVLGDCSFPVLVTRSAAPASYTGQDCAEIMIPGNPGLCDRVLQQFLSCSSVRLAGPGEFTARAYFADKLTLAQAEGIAFAIEAESQAQLSAAKELSGGAASRRYEQWADELANLLALVEAGIDFSDQEDVVAISDADLRARILKLAGGINHELGGQESGELVTDLPVVALVGPPNSGKSTLFNVLLGRRRSVVSPRRGTTRDVIRERLDLGSESIPLSSVWLLDLPGLDAGFAAEAGPIERAAQDAAANAAANADAWIWCDPRGRFEASGNPISSVPPGSRPRQVIRVRTFADLPGVSAPDAIPVCALDGWNLTSLRAAISDASMAQISGRRPLLARHRAALSRCVRALHEIPQSSPLTDRELVGASLRVALDSLEELTGRIPPDEIIGRVFSRFCVGK